jgi:hypothetical protein
MTERDLLLLAGAVDWPPTPDFASRLELAPRQPDRRRRALFVAVAAAVVAFAVAMAVPQARSSILRFLHIGSVTIERVETLPPAVERPLAVNLGDRVTPAQAEDVLGVPFALPDTGGEPTLYQQSSVISTLLATPEPVLLTETRAALMKKIAGMSTGVRWLRIAPGVDGVWIAGADHVYIGPEAPPRLAGNVLIWELDGVTFRLEARTLTRQRALELAREIST